MVTLVTIDRWRSLPFLDGTFPLPLDTPFTYSQARAEGLSRAVLAEPCRLALLRRPIKSVYAATQLGDSVETRARALRLVVPEDCVICDRHAGWLHGAEMVLAPNEHLALRPISVFRPSGMGRLRNGLADSGERNLMPSDIVELHGLRVTSTLRTTSDLGRQRNRDASLSGLDAMLRLGVNKYHVVGGVERFRGARWVTVLRELAPLADGRAESPGESVLRLRWIDTGLPAPRPQVPVDLPDGRRVFLDCGHEMVRVAGEYQGVEWHSSPEQVEHDDGRAGAVETEGWVVQPVWAANLWGRQQDIDRLLFNAFVEARRRFGTRILSDRRH
jgi:hypothetical protein